ncbi:methylenetetrahydrofolate reductase [Sphingomonas psychrotolerans]|uniref:Methylenetetrahydrofolate reductase n=1 Tax=Sphingomonas psychrotolerans TaxID=1327635 RepID=A0ABU3N2G4_9SPHN|nr:methylenetetrahydrofolate reductase [Sphingomonas psychrotolerans]MDT8758426.1 methylenetetrahydrofolate reductase [Sphingomonas psychrotolerans]
MNAFAPRLSPDARPVSTLLRAPSIEITSKDVTGLAGAAGTLAPGTPISITSLPGERLDQRLAAARAVLDNGFRPVPHIAARRVRSVQELETLVAAFADIGAAQHLFLVAGDQEVAEGPFPDSLALIRSGVLARQGVERIGIAGYPEGHDRIEQALLWAALRDKAVEVSEQGLELEIVTQFGFEADLAAAWIRRVRDEAITAPIRIGVPGPASAGALLRFAARCGVRASGSALRKYGLSVTKLMQSAGPDTYIADVAAALATFPAGDVGLRFYPFGGLASTVRWIAGAQDAARA